MAGYRVYFEDKINCFGDALDLKCEGMELRIIRRLLV